MSRALYPFILVVVASVSILSAQVPGPAAPRTAAERMQQPGPQEEQLIRDVGSWDVVFTIQPSPDAAPLVVRGLVADRRMVGLYLEEVMRPAPGSTTPDFRRISYLYYSRVEGRWQYVSLDTRFPVGIMPATSFGKEGRDTLTLQFESLGFVGLGPEVEGRMVRSNFVITRDSADHQFARQYWIRADGTGTEWLAVQYEYTRKR